MRVVGDVEVLADATLTVAAGVRVVFAGHHALRVGGRLLAIGTAAAPITFTDDDVAGLVAPAGWNGLRFEATAPTCGVSRLEQCVIEHATATWQGWSVGPLVVVGGANPQVVNAVIRDNVAEHGAALFCAHGAAPELAGCLITGNRALLGGAAVFSLDGYPRLIGCTIADNEDLNPEAFAEAAAVMSYYGKPRTTGCVLWGNTTSYFKPAQTWQTKAHATTWSDIEGGHDGVGNLDADPRFTGETPHPYALQVSSPCVDKGPLATVGWPATDLRGNLRVQHERVDLGAYELVTATAVGDDLQLAAMLAPLHPNPCNPRTRIAFQLPAAAHVKLRVVDLRGYVVRRLLDEQRPAGAGVVTWDGHDDIGQAVAAGAYLVSLEAGGRRETRRLLVVR